MTHPTAIAAAKALVEKQRKEKEALAQRIIDAVASIWGVPATELLRRHGPNTSKASARMTAMYLCVEVAQLAWAEAGRVFRVDDGTIMNAHRSVTRALTVAATAMAVRSALGVNNR